ncbi:MAG: alpha/beta hydrolase, partial [Bacteroidota bacterium]
MRIDKYLDLNKKSMQSILLIVTSLCPFYVMSQGVYFPFPESHFIEIHGVKLHYRRIGPPLPIPEKRILMLHGLGASTISWQPCIAPLVQQGFEILLVDLPPFGYSDGRRYINHSFSAQALLCWKLIDSVYQDTASWHLIGHSMGAAITGAMGAYRPVRTKSLTTVDGIVFNGGLYIPKSLSWLLRKPLSQDIVSLVGARFFFRERAMKRLLTSAYGRSPTVEEVQGYLTPLKKPKQAMSFLDILSRSHEAFDYSTNVLNMPFLIIWGDKDRWLPFGAGYNMKKDFPHAKMYLIPGAAHVPMETHTQEFLDLLLPF